jgi:tetratricopeptide (TPR) repeat protein
MKFLLILVLSLLFFSPARAVGPTCIEIFTVRSRLTTAIDLERLATQGMILNSLNTNPSEIYKTLQAQFEKNPEDIDLVYALGRFFYENKNFDVAMEYVSDAIEIRRDDLIVLDLKVDLLLSLGQYEKASALISRLIYEAPEAYRAWREQKYREDIQIYMATSLEVGHQRVRLDPKDVGGWLLAAVGAYSLKDWSRSEALIRIVLKLDPMNSSAIAMQFELDILTGNAPWTKAGWVERLARLKRAKYVRAGLVVAAYDQILKLDPTSSRYHAGKALFLYKNAMNYVDTFSRGLAGNVEAHSRIMRALEAVNRALLVNPSNASLVRAHEALIAFQEPML